MRIKRLLFLLAALAISLPLFSQEYVGDSCTTLLVGKKASSDGFVMTFHTCDPLPHLASPGRQIPAPVRDGLLGVPLPACPLGASHWVPCQRQNQAGRRLAKGG